MRAVSQLPNEQRTCPSACTHEEACARVAARFRERWLRMYAKRKLQSDPIFPAVFELLRYSDFPVVDVGCGVGLLALYLRERSFRPAVSGIDRDERKIERARAVSHGYEGLRFVQFDATKQVRDTGNIALIDVLHYLSPNDQRNLV